LIISFSFLKPSTQDDIFYFSIKQTEIKKQLESLLFSCLSINPGAFTSYYPRQQAGLF